MDVFQELVTEFASPIASLSLCGGGDSSQRAEQVIPACYPDIIGNKLTENLESRSKEKLTKVKIRPIKGSIMSKTNSPEELIRLKSSRPGHH